MSDRNQSYNSKDIRFTTHQQDKATQLKQRREQGYDMPHVSEVFLISSICFGLIVLLLLALAGLVFGLAGKP
ncbi:hypothetical protein [Lentilitoribacter sp. Alg239-R112]|uniref:hypothetical protein n=1 Tax=Lentilitoribacter sp. Alg239-R112 TaxID=2305987 RepID=UPI0013A6F229|nr:hypothetical protein [Lentilitoribacter sp. Alg239-R112]